MDTMLPRHPDTRKRSSLYSLTRRWLARLRPMSRSTCKNVVTACQVMSGIQGSYCNNPSPARAADGKAAMSSRQKGKKVHVWLQNTWHTVRAPLCAAGPACQGPALWAASLPTPLAAVLQMRDRCRHLRWLCHRRRHDAVGLARRLLPSLLLLMVVAVLLLCC